MNAEFNVWLLIVGLVVGAGLVWLVMMDSRRREADVDAVELPREAAWLSAVLAEDGFDVSPEAAEQLLLLHRAYLGAPPPDPIFEESAPADIPVEAPGSSHTPLDAPDASSFEERPTSSASSPSDGVTPTGQPTPDPDPVRSGPEPN